MNIVLEILLAGVVVQVGYYLLDLLQSLLRSTKKPSKHTPYPHGPRPIPFLGNIGTIHKLNTYPEKTCRDLAAKYGDVCMLWYGSSPAMVINSPRVAHELLHQMGGSTASRPDYNFNPYRHDISPGRLVTTPYGDAFRLIRKTYHSLLSPQQSLAVRPYQDEESKVFLRSLLDGPDSFLQGVEMFALNVIFSAVYGVRFSGLRHPIIVELYKISDQLLQYFLPGTLPFDIFPSLLKLPRFLQPWQILGEKLTRREAVVHRRLMKDLETKIEKGLSPDCFGKRLLQLQADQTIDDDLTMNMLAMLIGAGAGPTSSVLQTFFKTMALHPAAARTAQAELDRVVGPDRLPTWEDEPKLPYLRALIKEVHRWAPVGNIGVPHATTEDLVYQTWTIPKGTLLLPNLVALSKDEARYPNPELFDPRRHFDNDTHASASALHPDWKKRDHFHYGFGRRLCQGIHIAESSLYITIARVLWGFDIGMKAGALELNMANTIDGLVTKPKPFDVIITSRGETYEAVIKREMADTKMSLVSLEEAQFEV